MLDADEVAALTGHRDISLQEFDEVVPAAGSTHSAVRIAPKRMAELVDAEWVDVCQPPQAVQEPMSAPA
jgi:hypothetical protein